MLHTIEVEVDSQGAIHPLQPLPNMRERRGLLTLVIPEQSAPLPEKETNISSLFGILNASEGVSLELMATAIQERARTRWHDGN